MCCLQYEQAAYEEMKKLMPKTGKEIQTPDGNGIAVENNAITERTKVKLTLPDGTFDLRWYHYTELAKVGDPPPKPRETPAPADGEALSAPRPAAPRKPRSRKSAPAASAAQGAQPGAQPAGEGATRDLVGRVRGASRPAARATSPPPRRRRQRPRPGRTSPGAVRPASRAPGRRRAPRQARPPRRRRRPPKGPPPPPNRAAGGAAAQDATGPNRRAARRAPSDGAARTAR